MFASETLSVTKKARNSTTHVWESPGKLSDKRSSYVGKIECRHRKQQDKTTRGSHHGFATWIGQ